MGEVVFLAVVPHNAPKSQDEIAPSTRRRGNGETRNPRGKPISMPGQIQRSAPPTSSSPKLFPTLVTRKMAHRYERAYHPKNSIIPSF